MFYVGSAENLKEKLTQHKEPQEKNQKLRAFLNQDGEFVFRYAELPDHDLQIAVEKQMYKYYLPECNLEEPKGTLEVEANLN